jgi:hypothetical protein
MDGPVREPVDIDTYDQQQHMAGIVEQAIEEATNGSSRSRQSKANVLGVSDIGMCHEYVRRMIVGEEPSQEVHTYDMAAFVGTALGDKAEDAMIAAYPNVDWTKQAEVVVRLEVRGFELNIPGHPDLYSRTDLIDFKSKDGLGVIKRTGPSDQERFQRALYAKALIEQGEMDEECWLHNVYLDRSGGDPKPVVWSSRFTWAEVEEAVEWIDNVLYAIQQGEEAQRDPSREWCWACCPFAPQCRGMDDSDVEGKIEDPFVLEAIRIYVEASADIKALDKDKRSAASVLSGYDGGVTDSHKFRWIDVGESPVPAYTRAGYRRLDIRPLRLPKRKVKDDE